MFRQFPFVDVAFGPGQVHKLAEFLTSDSLTAQGFFEFEGFTGHLPAKRAREFQGWVQISAGCNMVCSYCIVPVDPRARGRRGRSTSSSPRSRGWPPTACARSRCSGQNVNSYGRAACGRGRSFAELLRARRRDRRHRPHPLHEPAPDAT